MSIVLTPTTTVGNFRFWCQKVLPAVYDDSLSYYELLAKVVAKLNEVIDSNNVTSDAVSELQQAVTEINNQFEQFKAHGFDDYYADQVATWIMQNMEWIFLKTIRQVYFGLTLDGHFVAYIPESWNDIDFDTGINYSEDTYGRLILRWNADSPNRVDQTPERVR
jgi:hypothetical protein